MSPKKQYQKRLPTVLPPVPRPAPAAESLPPRADPEPELEPELEPQSDPEPEPEPAPRATELWEEDPQPPSRRRTAVVLLALLAVVASAATLAVRLLDGSDGRDAAASRVGGRASSTAVEVPPGSSRVTARVRADGDIVVTQRIASREPIDALTLTVPPLRDVRPLSATGLRVVADGEVVPSPGRVADLPAEVRLDGATDLVVRYRLVGAVQGSSTVPGRALALATALDVRWSPAPERETRVVRAPGVLALACSPAPDEAPVPCGTARGADRWRVELEGASVGARVLAQLTVPGLDDSAG